MGHLQVFKGFTLIMPGYKEYLSSIVKIFQFQVILETKIEIIIFRIKNNEM